MPNSQDTGMNHTGFRLVKDVIDMNMKTRIIKLSTIFLIAIFSNSAWSQSVEFTPSYGYQFGAKVSDLLWVFKSS